MTRLPDHLDEVDGNAAVAAYQSFTDAVLDALGTARTVRRELVLEHFGALRTLEERLVDAVAELERRLTAIFEHPSRPTRRLAPVRPLSLEERGELQDALRRAHEENTSGWRPAP